jgi:hypothetical protein
LLADSIPGATVFSCFRLHRYKYDNRIYRFSA